jgi:folate-binding protein YgfZ
MTAAATTGRGGADSYGDVTGEYLALRTGAGIVAGWHDLVWVRGPDAVRFLDGLLSQAIEPVAPGGVARSLLLSPQGKLRAPHVLLRGVDEVGLLTDLGGGVVVEEDLRRFKIRVDVAIEADPRAVVDVWGPAAAAVAEEVLGGALAADGWERRDDVVVAAVPFALVPLPRLAVVGVGIDRLVAAGAVRCGRLACDAVRIEAGEPLMGVDIDEKTIAQEADLVDGAVDFTKGCYLGQELIARIDSRGHVNRRLRGVRLTTNLLPPIGAEVRWGGDPMGTISSIAESLTLSAPVGLAMVRRQVEPAAPVTLRWPGGEAAAVVERLPLDPTLGA